MNKISLLFLLLALLPLQPGAAEEPIVTAAYIERVSVDAEIDLYRRSSQMPIKGSVSVTHDQRLKVDENSFSMDGNPLAVELLQQVRFSPDSYLVLSIYRFELPAKPPGVHTLPEISVDVGGTTYHSKEVSYEIEEPRNFSY